MKGRPRLGVEILFAQRTVSKKGGTAESCVRDITRLLHAGLLRWGCFLDFPVICTAFCTKVTGCPQTTAENLCTFASCSLDGLLTFDSAPVVTEQYATQRSGKELSLMDMLAPRQFAVTM